MQARLGLALCPGFSLALLVALPVSPPEHPLNPLFNFMCFLDLSQELLDIVGIDPNKDTIGFRVKLIYLVAL